jgi:hypothetical protein
MKDGIESSYEDYRKATRRLERLRLESDEALDAYDVLMTPSPRGGAEGLGTTGNAIFNSIWTALGTPAVTLRLFKGPSGCRSDCSSLPAASGTGAFSTSPKR